MVADVLSPLGRPSTRYTRNKIALFTVDVEVSAYGLTERYFEDVARANLRGCFSR
jgi:hypothetical protein